MTDSTDRKPVPPGPPDIRHVGPVGPGTVLDGKYEIIRKIGEGGMGAVYEARELDPAMDRTVAVKVLPHDLMRRDPTLERRFRSEVRIATRMDHPNIIPIYNVGQHGPLPYFVMKYVKGKTLRELLPGTLGLEVDQLVSIAQQVGRALRHIHENGAIHRDIKANNIMVDGAGHATLMDFGISKSDDSTFVTASGEIMGTGPYLAPEQWDGKTDHRADIFAYGVVLYEISTGKLPFQGKTIPELMNAILNKNPTPITKFRPDLPEAFAKTVMRCLEKDPDRRLQTMLDVLMSLEGKAVETPEPEVPTELIVTRPPAGVEPMGDATRALKDWERRRDAAPEHPDTREAFEKYTELAEKEEQVIVAAREALDARDRKRAEKVLDEFLKANASRRVQKFREDLDLFELSTDRLLEQAKRLEGEGQEPRAVELYRRVLEKNPDHPRAKEAIERINSAKRRGRALRADDGRGLVASMLTWALRASVVLVVLAIFLPKFSPRAGSAMFETLGDVTVAIGLRASPKYVSAFDLYGRALKYKKEGEKDALLEKRQAIVRHYVELGDQAMTQNFTQLAADNYAVAARLDPDDKTAQAKLKHAQSAAAKP